MAKQKTKTRPRLAKPSPRTIRDLSRFISKVKLRFVRLLEAHCSLEIRDGKAPTVMQVKLGAGRIVATEGQTNIIAVHVRVTVEGHPSGVTTNTSRLLIVAGVECQYESETPPTELEAHEVQGMGTLTAWPHLRDFVSSISMRMGQPPILLPLLHIDPETKQLRLLGDDVESPPR